MNWIAQGGMMTWPLLALSAVMLAILIDRGIVFSTLRLPNAAEEAAILDALRKGDHGPPAHWPHPLPPSYRH